MSIQSSINQALSIGGLLYTQTGGYKAKQEKILAEQQKQSEIQNLKEQITQAGSSVRTAQEGMKRYAEGTPVGKESIQLAAKASDTQAEAFEKLFQLEPSSQHLLQASIARNRATKLSNRLYDTEVAREANKRAADRVNAMSEQKQSAQRYMMLLKEDKQ